MLKRCYAITLNTADAEKIKEFYTGVLGLPVLAERLPLSVTIDLAGVSVTFESFYGKPDSYAEFYVETDDVPHLCARLRAAGHNVPREWRHKAELKDPEGRKVVLTETVGI